MANVFTQAFDDKGDFPKDFDPYRSADHPLMDLLFDEGHLRDGLRRELVQYIEERDLSHYCDAVALYHADIHGSSTKGSYPAIYYWR